MDAGHTDCTFGAAACRLAIPVAEFSCQLSYLALRYSSSSILYGKTGQMAEYRAIGSTLLTLKENGVAKYEFGIRS